MPIRNATPADIVGITRIYARSVIEETASFELEPPDETEMALRMARLQEQGYPYRVDERDGRIAGYAYAGPYRPRPAYNKTIENTVYVDPAFWRMGIARGLLQDLIEQCCLAGYREMIAVIGGADHLPSIALHESLGFSQVGRLKRVGYKHGRWLDSVLLQRSLV